MIMTAKGQWAQQASGKEISLSTRTSVHRRTSGCFQEQPQYQSFVKTQQPPQNPKTPWCIFENGVQVIIVLMMVSLRAKLRLKPIKTGWVPIFPVLG